MIQTALLRQCVVFFAIVCLAHMVRADTATLTVNVGQPGAKISPSLYGIFFEEINHAGDGGLYAEMVRNRAFEDADTPRGWSLVTRGAAEGKMALDADRPLNDKTTHSLRLEIPKAAKGSVGVANDGYWGMAVRRKARYEISLFARCGDGFKGPLTVAIENAAGQACATGKIEGLTADWKRFSCSLTARDSATSARLVLSAASPGTIWFDVVSLFPEETWKNRPNGLRTDLMGMLDDLKPAFARFPGGCFVEGDVLRNAFRWKNTIGDIAERPGHWNLWNYRSTDGLGYHEYLQMCEDLGADPMFVINCGMAHKDNVPMSELEPWVQDALDAIEYANGPANSQWGVRRAKNGHPKPFGLKYLEIGNENGGAIYNEHYGQFYKTVKARYPEIQLIANTRVKSAPMEILDEHYYNSPDWFAANAAKYDSYDRSGPKIYVGEYACTRDCGKGNLRAAVGEAAFMTGMERNADIVVMASYAPLFVNVHDRRWNPDTIGFDSAACYGTPSYHVQKMFSRNRGDVVLPSTLTCKRAPAPALTGAIGLATWRTQAEFKDVKVTRGGQTLLAADLAEDARGWRAAGGEWKVQDGAYRQTGTAEDLRSTAGDPAWSDYTYTLKARKIGGAEGFLIMFAVRDRNNWFWWNIGGWGNVRHAIERCAGGRKSEVGNSVPGRIETGRWYDIKIELQGSRIRCYLDGKLIHDVSDSAPEALAAVASRINKTGDIVLKVVNTSDAPQETQVSLDGARGIASRGTAIALTSNSPEDENSLAQPTLVAPVEKRVSGLGPKFKYTFPPYSVTILRLSAEK